MTPYYQDERVVVHAGDCLNVLRTLPDASVDAVVTDPPAGIAFMSKSWDHHKGGRDQWVAWLADVMRECLRVTKPGGHAFVWALPRTSHWTATAVEDAGWEVRDCVVHLFGSGFPKSLDVSKAIDKAAGATREVTSTERSPFRMADPKMGDAYMSTVTGDTRSVDSDGYIVRKVTAPATDDARTWQGWGTALKPASEHWWLARKPFQGTVAQSVLAHGTGALNIDGCRVGSDGGTRGSGPGPRGDVFDPRPGSPDAGLNGSFGVPVAGLGRWPPNVVLSHLDDCQQGRARPGGSLADTHGAALRDALADRGVGTLAWECAPNCPVAELDRQSGTLKGRVGMTQHGSGTNAVYGKFEQSAQSFVQDGTPDSGGSSRFFPVFRYEAKAPTSERPRVAQDGASGEGIGYSQLRCLKCGGLQVDGRASRCSCLDPEFRIDPSKAGHVAHPTVKPLDLMRWLVRLVTPPGGLVLDCFAGSGTTGEACVLEGFKAILIEREVDYLPLIVSRFTRRSDPVAWIKATGGDGGLFDLLEGA